MERDRSDPRSIRAKSYTNTPHRARQKKISRRDDARFQSRQPRPTSDGFSNAELAIKTHCQRQRLPHPSDRRWKACQEAAPIYPQPSGIAGGERVEASTRCSILSLPLFPPLVVRSLKNAFFRHDIDELTISADMG